MNTRQIVGLVTVIFMMMTLLTVPFTKATIGAGDNGILVTQWTYNMQSLYTTILFGSSSAIADMKVNNVGGEPNADLEIVVGSDEYSNNYPELGGWANGIWRLLDSQGNLEWAKNTGTDESRSSPNVADIDGDGYLDIVGGTTSGWNVEAMDRFGNFIWTFPWPPQTGGPFMFHSSPAVADVISGVNLTGPEVFIGSRAYGPGVWALDGDNSDKWNDGITATDSWIYGGAEGKDWDVLWKYSTGIVNSSPALGDVDNDGVIEVVIGSQDGNIYVLDGTTGALEWSYLTGGSVDASAALANLDGDASLEIVIGSGDGYIYCLDGTTGSVEWTYFTGIGNAVYSSAAIGDVDSDGAYEIVVGSDNGNIYCLDAAGSLEWSYLTGGAVRSSAALANRGTGGLDIYIGSDDHYLYLIQGGGGGAGGTLIDRFETYGRLYTSPSVADVDGDSRLEIVFYDADPGRWDPTGGYYGTGAYEYTFWAIEDTGSSVPSHSIEWQMFRHDSLRTGLYPIVTIPVYVDIKPGSWPNPLNLASRGVLPVAICGTANFDVTTINVTTIKLTREGLNDGVSPIRWAYEDVATPWTGPPGGGHALGGDGYLDLTLKFRTQEVRNTLGLDPFEKQVIPLIITGNLNDAAGGTPIMGQDYAWILKLPGDCNDDLIVDIVDFSVISAHWYPGPPMGSLGYDAVADLNDDGAVNIVDVAITSAQWLHVWQP